MSDKKRSSASAPNQNQQKKKTGAKKKAGSKSQTKGSAKKKTKSAHFEIDRPRAEREPTPADRGIGPRLGAHMSIAGGVHTALERGWEGGCDIIQLFSKNNNQWDAKPFSEQDLASWRNRRDASGVTPSIVHDSYLINHGSPDPDLWARSVDAFAEIGRASCRERVFPVV